MTTPTGVVLHQSFEEHKRKLILKKSHTKYINIELRNVILMNRQSTMGLFCNPKLVGNIYKAKKKMHLKSNRGNMIITNKAQVAGYKPHVWFDQNLSPTSSPSIISLNSSTSLTISWIRYSFSI